MTTFIGHVRKADIRADTISKRKDGTVVLRRGFFYKNGFTADQFVNHIMSKLIDYGMSARVVDSGEIWKPFNGGSTLANSSHWFVVLAEK